MQMKPLVLGTPAEALEILRRGEKFDVAVIDMQMPGMDGIGLARDIRAARSESEMPIVMLTSGAKDDGPPPVGVAAVINKPIKTAQLAEVLLRVCALTTEGPGAPARQSPVTPPPQDGSVHFLLAEDNPVNQKVALRMLEKLGYRADVAANGVEVLQALERKPYDVILMDVLMPEMDGLEATRLIRNRGGEIAQPVIIALTANALAGDRERCLSAGMDDYLTKPLQLEQLRMALELKIRAIKAQKKAS
jgi:CheY-like chemotaxis protein